jgi:enolase-phosphatase E1
MSLKIKYILTDIEGTTTSVSFVYDVLFPYFRKNISKIENLIHLPEVSNAISETHLLAREIDGKDLKNTAEIIEHLLKWSLEDRKITPLKTLQGILWNEAYKSGEIKGHIYEDVLTAFQNWKKEGLSIGIFSSGSIQAQKLIFAYSDHGDLSVYLSNYFDTTTGTKRESSTYFKISKELNLKPENILFLSDIVEELYAADEIGYETIQLLRDGTQANWKKTVSSFSEIRLK